MRAGILSSLFTAASQHLAWHTADTQERLIKQVRERMTALLDVGPTAPLIQKRPQTGRGLQASGGHVGVYQHHHALATGTAFGLTVERKNYRI